MLKGLAVTGERLPGAAGTAHDAVMVNGLVIQTATTDQFASNLTLLAGTTCRLGIRFSVRTGLAAHCPLGNIDRARKATYDHSAGSRERFRRCPIHEPAATPGG